MAAKFMKAPPWRSRIDILTVPWVCQWKAVIDDFSKYRALKDEGQSVSEVCASARTDGLDQEARIRMLRQVFGLPLGEAKKVRFEVDTGRSFNAHQADLARVLAHLDDDGLDD